MTFYLLYIVPVLTLTIPVLPLIILYKKKGFLAKPLIIGIGLLVLTLIVQPVIQYLPVQMLGIDLKNPSPEAIVPLLLYAALVSGFFQEYLKYIGVKGKETLYALWVGGGFGLGETLLVAFNQVVAMVVGIGFPLILGLLAVYERLATLTYHMFSAGILAYYSVKGKGILVYIILAITHSLMNFQAILLTRMYGYTVLSLIVVYGVITIVSLSTIIYHLKVVCNG